ncbi:AbiH family protein [Enterococcus faecalis]|uniref:AbiH family protein n=1 Tax=Enterococcus faecalis TaxID=1351 RepID=UPI0010BFABC3|nr:AbiH family protein [Enterococcus faecalis]TKP21042.1 hypothetical protein DVY37_06250 [Enterococcus faecalis]
MMEEKVKKEVKKPSRIVIIGNGFDVSVGLKSRYDHFVEYIRNKHDFLDDVSLYEYNQLFLKKYEDFNLNWSDFESLYEETVRKVNSRTKYEDLQDSFEITGINKAIRQLEHDFSEYIIEEYDRWIQKNTLKQANEEVKKFSKKINPFFQRLLRDEETSFINFNYTNTLEDISTSIFYDDQDADTLKKSSLEIRKVKNRIFHIHGNIEDNNILFGGGFTDREDIKNIHYSKSLLNDKLFRIKEDEQLSKIRETILQEIDEKKEQGFDLYILGHSLQGSDFPFLKKILKKANRIFIFYYQTDYTSKMEELLRGVGSSVVEKITLVPFPEIFFEEPLLIENYNEYKSIETFLNNKFPKEEILADLSLTAQHFIFRNICELTITNENVDIVFRLLENLIDNKVKLEIKCLFFDNTLSKVNDVDIEEDGETLADKILSKKSILTEVLSKVEKIALINMSIDSKGLKNILSNGQNIEFFSLNHCSLVDDGNNEVNMSLCENLQRLEIKDCTFESRWDNQSESTFVFTCSRYGKKLEKLFLYQNTQIVVDNNLLEYSKGLTQLYLVLSDTDTHTIQAHLDNLKILQLDCSKTSFPSISVGNKIEEITITGYPNEALAFSSIMKSSDKEIGFKKLRLFQLISPDIINRCEELAIDVLVDYFSEELLLIVDEERMSIDKYYKNRKYNINEFLGKTKDVSEKIVLSFGTNRISRNNSLLKDFEDWYQDLHKLLGAEKDTEELIISTLKEKLRVSDDNNIIEKVTTKKETSEHRNVLGSVKNYV